MDLSGGILGRQEALMPFWSVVYVSLVFCRISSLFLECCFERGKLDLSRAFEITYIFGR